MQKQVLPIGPAADFHHLCGTCELLSQILAPFFPLSFHLFLLISTPFNPCWLTSSQLHLSNSFSTMSKRAGLRTTKLAQSASQYYFVLQSLHKVRPSTTSYYKACTKIPVKITGSRSRNLFVGTIQNSHPKWFTKTKSDRNLTSTKTKTDPDSAPIKRTTFSCPTPLDSHLSPLLLGWLANLSLFVIRKTAPL